MYRSIFIVFAFSLMAGVVYAYNNPSGHSQISSVATAGNGSGADYSERNMTDKEAAAYIANAQKIGVPRSQIATTLLSQGFSAERIRALYTRPETVPADSSGSRLRSPVAGETDADTSQDIQSGQWSGKEIFGHNIFNRSDISFEPAVNLPTPADYKLGPGDEVIVDVWGENEASIRGTISPDGFIFAPVIGQIYLSGKTIKEANEYMQKQFGRIYSGDGGESNISLTLGQIRTIQINVMGEVVSPGTYSLSSFASAFYAVYRSGGINDIGSLRDIRVMRGGKQVAQIDVYDYIMNGNTAGFMRLDEGDVVIVPPFDNLVNISGKVKRPMYYEMKNGEGLDALIGFSGGFSGDAYSKSVRLTRFNGTEKEAYNVDREDFSSFMLIDGDRVDVGAVLDRYVNRVEVEGAVFRAGPYQMTQGMSVLELIKKAEGVREDAFLDRAVLTRQKEDLTLETLQIDLRGILNGSSEDIKLHKNDVLYVPSIFDLMEERVFSIAGAVARPGDYVYADNTTLEDLVIRAGGLLESASVVRVEVARRLKDPKSTAESKEISRTFVFSLKDNYVVEGPAGFVLEPFDYVYVRTSPGYVKQRNVTVTGEVLFEGEYALTNKNERLSDLVEKAGGITSTAYVRGARIERTMNSDERKILETALKMAKKGGPDSLSVETIETGYTYNVGIELDKALANPGSDNDMVLREGDKLIIPEYVSTVKINGAVLHSNTVLYSPGKNGKYYINQAGGFAARAKRSKIYVMYLNGTVSKYKSAKDIEPGCEIFVPSKAERRNLSPAEVFGIATSATSLATMGVAISNAVK